MKLVLTLHVCGMVAARVMQYAQYSYLLFYLLLQDLALKNLLVIQGKRTSYLYHQMVSSGISQENYAEFVHLKQITKR